MLTKADKKRDKRQKVKRFISGGKCRRIFLDQEIDRRRDRVRCEEGEERCNVCRRSDVIIEELEEQRQTYIQEEARRGQEKQDRFIDSGINIPSSSIPFSGLGSDNIGGSVILLASSPPRSQSSVVSFDQGFIVDQVTATKREEFRGQQSQRQEQRLRIKEENQQAGQEV
jgi:hypothetical protein